MKNSLYSFVDYIRLIYSYLLTKLFFSPARIVRQPCRIRGWQYIKVGCGFTTGQYCRIEAGSSHDGNATLVFGDNVQINDSCHISALYQVNIGNNVLIASRVYVSDHDHGQITKESMLIKPLDRPLIIKPIFIEDDVWIGEGVSILKGVTIGKGAVIGAGAVVTRNIPSYSLAVGVPAKVIKSL
jgi:lipopolysaccharide O-acetyltransferase